MQHLRVLIKQSGFFVCCCSQDEPYNMNNRVLVKARPVIPLPVDYALTGNHVTLDARQELLKHQNKIFGAFAIVLSALAALRFRKTR